MKLTLINLSMSEESYKILCSSVERRLAERECSLGEGGYTLTLAVDPSLCSDRYIILPNQDGAELTAANDASLHAAVGHLLHTLRFDGRGGFTPICEKVDFTPASPLRGMYFATHFHNFYHNAPIERVYEVIEDLALRGCNAIQVWYDMHHYASISDPSSVKLISRLKAFMQHAKSIGMKLSMTMLSNEAFCSSPTELRAEWDAKGSYHTRPMDHYHVEICPSRAGGLEELLKERRTVFEAFSDVRLDFVCLWPYDQGGCTCKDCAPYGANGMMKLLPGFTALLREFFPTARLIYSTWYFDKFVSGEWDAFYSRIRDGELKDVEYIMSFFFGGVMPKVIVENGVPEGVKFIDFPEISMYSCEPWGAYGMNPLPGFLGEAIKKSGHLYSGGFPYSEGIYEDINKFIVLSHYSGRHEDTFAAVADWARFELCNGDEELVSAIIATETSLARTKYQKDRPYRFVIKDTHEVERIFEVFSKYDGLLPEKIRRSTRWRMLYLRALIDRELTLNDFYPSRSKKCEDAFKELYGLYHSSKDTHRWLCPPIED